MRFRREAVLALAALAASSAHAAPVPVTNPEGETLRLSKKLKPIANAEWEGIAGGRIAETYEIAKGDTLWGVSARLFGDPRYWPKIWSINNGSILNPHLIRPGKKVVFLPGTETTLPGVSVISATDAPSAVQGATNSNEPIDPATIRRADEWRTLPRQSWEQGLNDVIPAEKQLSVEESGVKALRSQEDPLRTELNGILSGQPPVPWGEVVGSRSEALQLSMGDVLFVKSPYDLQVGRLYTVIGETSTIRSPFTERSAFLTPKLATIKIIGIRDRVFVAAIVQATEAVTRGSRVVDHIMGAPKPRMIPGPSPLEGMILSDPRNLSRMIAQDRQYYVDRGSRDGVQPGMIFRSFQHRDVGTGAKISDANFLVDSDFIVLQTAENFSTVLCLSGQAQIGDRILVTLLQDVSDAGTLSEEIRSGGRKEAVDANPALRDLERIDEIEGIGHDEQRELEQIESLPSNTLPGTGQAPEGKTTEDLRIQIPDDPLESEQLPPPPGHDPELDAPSAPAPDTTVSPPPAEVPTDTTPPSAPRGIELSPPGEGGDELPLPPPPT